MSGLIETLLGRARLVVTITVLLALTGLAAWLTMPREEDPQFPERNGLILVHFPGADAEVIERLLINPIEEHLAEVQEIFEVYSTSRPGIGIVRAELRDQVYDTDSVWDDVEDKLAAAAREFPAGASAPSLDSDLVSQEAVILAISGSGDPLELVAAAERLKLRLLRLANVKQVKVIGDPGEQITIEYDDGTARRLGVDPRLLAAQLGTRMQVLPGGTLRLGDRAASLRPQTDLGSIAEIEATPITLPNGANVPLGALARVRHGAAEPPAEVMRVHGETVVALGVIPRDGIDRVAFGEQIRTQVEKLAPSIAPLQLEEVLFQPDLVDQRLTQLSRSLLIGICIVAAVLFLAMGLRLGLLVAVVVPLVTFSSVAVYAIGGGILHQISISALVLALGMLVDNAIVMVEAIQGRLDAGVPMREAMAASVRELAAPLGSATGTTLAAFVPMLIAKGNTADFTRSIPVVIMLTLTVSYLFAVLVTPVLARVVLRPRPGAATAPHRVADRISRVSSERPMVVLGLLLVVVAVSGASAGLVKKQFFPAADRTTVIAELELPEGTHIDRTLEVVENLERELLGHDEVAGVTSYVGRAAPHFYYNLLARPNAPHTADLVIETHELEQVVPMMAHVRKLVGETAPEAQVVAKRLEQGPPIASPVEVRVSGDSLEELELAADRVLAAVRAIPGTSDVRHDLGLGMPTVRFEIDDAAAANYGLDRTDVALALLGRTRGLVAGQYRAGDDPVAVVVRSAAGEELPVNDLQALDVGEPGGRPVPLGELARIDPEWRPAAIYHRNGQRVVTVSSQLADGATSAEVLARFAEISPDLDLPEGITLELGGEAAESGQANAAILGAVPIGVMLLLFFLLVEFDSIRRVGIVLVTVPLAAAGVFPGLLLAGQPFGFMAMLGVIALVGIVVNNAIVLLDVIEREREAGAGINDALREATRRRLRPILLTMATTVAGLFPLAISPTTLWPPLAWAMISGLIASTGLTLFAVPALYRVLFREGGSEEPGFDGDTQPGLTAKPIVATLLLVLALGLGATPPADAAEAITIEQAMALARERPAALAADARAEAASLGATAARRTAWLPGAGVEANTTRRDRAFELATPIGPFALGDRTSRLLAVELVQPLFDPAKALFVVPAAQAGAAAARAAADHTAEQLMAEAASRHLAVLAIEARIAATESFITALEARVDETAARVRLGRVLESEALALEIELDWARLERTTLAADLAVARRTLGLAIGRDADVHAAALDPDRPRAPAPEADEVLPAVLERRADLRAALSRIDAARLQARAIGAETLPRLEARGRFTASSGDAFVPDDSSQATLALSWRPLAAFTRGPRQRAAEAELRALEAERAELARSVRVHLEAAAARVDTAAEALAVGRRGVELASERARVERERYAAGRVTANDLLAAEARLRERITFAALADLELEAARIHLLLVSGELGR
jgi:multidrug efflux pump subunit AcrB/outer membrane protein TolC